jgi:hypothetical protein
LLSERRAASEIVDLDALFKKPRAKAAPKASPKASPRTTRAKSRSRR